MPPTIPPQVMTGKAFELTQVQAEAARNANSEPRLQSEAVMTSPNSNSRQESISPAIIDSGKQSKRVSIDSGPAESLSSIRSIRTSIRSTAAQTAQAIANATNVTASGSSHQELEQLRNAGAQGRFSTTSGRLSTSSSVDSDQILQTMDDLHESSNYVHMHKMHSMSSKKSVTGKSKSSISDHEETESCDDAWRNRAGTIIDSHSFRLLVIGTIIVNAIQLGASVEWPDEPYKTIWLILEHVFTVIFFFEMAIKVFALRCGYFFSKWNILDFVLICIGMLDNWVLQNLKGTVMNNVTVFRVFKLMKLVRIFKVLRVQREIEILVEGIGASLKSMFWISCFLALILYAFGIFFTVAVGEETYPPEANFDCKIYFGSILRSMLSLFNMVLLAEWTQIVRPVFENQTYVVPAFVILCVFLSFGLLNVIVGVIVESTSRAAEHQHELDLERRRHAQMAAAQALADLCESMDTNDDGVLTKKEFARCTKHEGFMDLIAELGLPKGFGLADLYLVLDRNLDQELTKKEFINGMYQLTYSSEFQRLCIAQLSIAQVKQLIKGEQQAMRDELRRSLDNVSREIASFRTGVGNGHVSKLPACASGYNSDDDVPLESCSHIGLNVISKESDKVATLSDWIPLPEGVSRQLQLPLTPVGAMEGSTPRHIQGHAQVKNKLLVETAHLCLQPVTLPRTPRLDAGQQGDIARTPRISPRCAVERPVTNTATPRADEHVWVDHCTPRS